MNDRIKSITDAAACLFLQQGYSKTQISHIAKAVGVSVGTIYLDFTGKKEIIDVYKRQFILHGGADELCIDFVRFKKIFRASKLTCRYIQPPQFCRPIISGIF